MISKPITPRLSPPHVHAPEHEPFRPGSLKSWLDAHGLRHAGGAWAAIKLWDASTEYQTFHCELLEECLVFMAEADELGFKLCVTVVPKPTDLEPEIVLTAAMDYLARHGIRPMLVSWDNANQSDLGAPELEVRAGRTLKALGQHWMICDNRGPIALLTGMEHRLRTAAANGVMPDAVGFHAHGVDGWWGTAHWGLMREALARRGWKGPVIQTEAGLAFTQSAQDELKLSTGQLAGAWQRENRNAAAGQNAAAVAYDLQRFVSVQLGWTPALAELIGASVAERPPVKQLHPGAMLRRVRAMSVRILQAGGASLEEALDRVFPITPLPTQAVSPKLPVDLCADDDVGNQHLLDGLKQPSAAVGVEE